MTYPQIKRIAILISIAVMSNMLAACSSAFEMQSSSEVESQMEAIYRSSKDPSSSPTSTPGSLEVHWQILYDRAVAMETYLGSMLSHDDHGGIFIFDGTFGDTLEDTANNALAVYSGEKSVLVLLDSPWS